MHVYMVGAGADAGGRDQCGRDKDSVCADGHEGVLLLDVSLHACAHAHASVGARLWLCRAVSVRAVPCLSVPERA